MLIIHFERAIVSLWQGRAKKVAKIFILILSQKKGKVVSSSTPTDKRMRDYQMAVIIAANKLEKSFHIKNCWGEVLLFANDFHH